ncbi:MAG: apolipoprotein N-acyltransferase [Cyanobacteria bacterium PR.023]|jgi:apolipoprotein N-acyltransferase|nr:apolipoprotein N-acyltransferase [Cyanobacteria bacterium PR.023]
MNSYSFSSEIQVSPVSVTPKAGWLDSQRLSLKLPIGFLMGAILALATPGFDQAYLAWFGLIPLLILIRACNSPWQSVFTGFTFGAGYYAIALSFFTGMYPLRWLGLHDAVSFQIVWLAWLVEVIHYSSLTALFALFVFCLPLRPSFLPNHRRPFYPYLIAVPSIWVFLQWVVATSPLFFGSPLSQLAYTQSRNLPLIQLAAVGGSGLVDFVIVMFNAACAQMIIETTGIARNLGERTDQLNIKFGSVLDLFLCCLAIAFALNWGGQRIAQIEDEVRPEHAIRFNPQTPPIPVTIVQGNVSIENERFKAISAAEFCGRYNELTANTSSSLVVLPEGVVTLSQMGQGGLLPALKHISQEERKEIIYGAIEPLKNGHINVARLVSPFGYRESAYVKQRLVPFGEIVPESLRDKLPTNSEVFLAAQKAQIIRSGWGKIGVAICNEVIFPKIVSDQVRDGASLIVVLANLGWFHNSSLNKQYLACATLRAVENKRFLVLSTNTGISGVIDPAGLVVSKSYALQRGVLTDTVQFIYSKTPFNRMHWL